MSNDQSLELITTLNDATTNMTKLAIDKSTHQELNKTKTIEINALKVQIITITKSNKDLQIHLKKSQMQNIHVKEMNVSIKSDAGAM